MFNTRALLLYSFSEYLTTANMPKDIDLKKAVNDEQIIKPFVNKLNQYAMIDASLSKTQAQQFNKDHIQHELQEITKGAH